MNAVRDATASRARVPCLRQRQARGELDSPGLELRCTAGFAGAGIGGGWASRDCSCGQFYGRQGKAAKAPKRAGSKLWMPKSAAVDSPRIIVEGDKESKMAGLTELRKEVIMDMEDFAENEVSAADTPPDSPLPLP